MMKRTKRRGGRARLGEEDESESNKRKRDLERGMELEKVLEAEETEVLGRTAEAPFVSVSIRGCV